MAPTSRVIRSSSVAVRSADSSTVCMRDLLPSFVSSSSSVSATRVRWSPVLARAATPLLASSASLPSAVNCRRPRVTSATELAAEATLAASRDTSALPLYMVVSIARAPVPTCVAADSIECVAVAMPSAARLISCRASAVIGAMSIMPGAT